MLDFCLEKLGANKDIYLRELKRYNEMEDAKAEMDKIEKELEEQILGPYKDRFNKVMNDNRGEAEQS